jgi:hypothetical protein
MKAIATLQPVAAMELRISRTLSSYFFDLRFFAVFFFAARFGTFFPSRRASESPIAIACFRLFTFLPERPLFSVPAGTLIRRPQPVSNPGFGQHKLRALRVSLDLLPELAHINP